MDQVFQGVQKEGSDSDDDGWLEEREENPLEKLPEAEKTEWYSMFEPKDASAGQLFVLVGKSEKGKTHFLKWLLYKGLTRARAPFLFGLIFVRTKFKLSYRFHPESEGNVKVMEGFNLDVLKQYVCNLEKRYKAQGYVEPSFIVFDDLVGVLNNEDSWFQNFIGTYRHFNITLFIAVQYLTGRKSISPIMREQTTAAIMFNSKVKRTMVNLYENYGQLFDTQREFDEHMAEMTEEGQRGTRHACCIYFEAIDDIRNNYMSWLAPKDLPDNVLVPGIEMSSDPKRAGDRETLSTPQRQFLALQAQLEKEGRGARFTGRLYEEKHFINTAPRFSDPRESVAHMKVVEDLMHRHHAGLLRPDDEHFKRVEQMENNLYRATPEYRTKKQEHLKKITDKMKGLDEIEKKALLARLKGVPLWLLQMMWTQLSAISL